MLVVFLAPVFAAADGNVLSDEASWHQGRYDHLVVLEAPFLGAFSTSRRLHNALATAVLLAFIFIIVTRFWNPR